MCGIAGYVDFDMNSGDSVLENMISSLIHRGPDGQGKHIVSYDQYQLGFCHTRLSIIDLTEGGDQPMFFNGLTIVYNGEIYNYKEIRRELQSLGHTFQSDSDTEVILHAYSQWKNECVGRFIGMFAFAIHDSVNHELIMIRDRAGVKPLYYFQKGGLLIFGSELKALLQHPGFEKELNQKSVNEYLNTGFINHPNSIFNNCHKLPPGSIIQINLLKRETTTRRYWNPADFCLQPRFAGDYTEAKEHLKSLLCSSFEYRMVSDVPVGIFLSGGIDSSLLVALLKNQGFDDLKTFTIGFPDGKNEAPQARRIAEHFQTDHNQFDFLFKDVENIIHDLPRYFDEPMADNSTIPTMFVSQMARNQVTVALSADGGDETFAGYRRYQACINYLNSLNKVPGVLRKPLSQILKPMSRNLPDAGKKYGDRAELFARLIGESPLNRASVYKSYFEIPTSIRNRILGTDVSDSTSIFHELNEQELGEELQMLLWDYQTYLPNDILAKVDRAGMSCSLEGREPLLDHRIWEFAATLPKSFRSGSESKQILKDILGEFIPKSLTEMPKSGFSMPMVKWMKSELRDLVEDSLSLESLKKTGVFDPIYCNQIKSQFMNGSFGYGTLIWRLVHFQQWYKHWM